MARAYLELFAGGACSDPPQRVAVPRQLKLWRVA